MAVKFAIALSLVLLGTAGCDFGTKEFKCSIDTECPASGGEYGRCVNSHCAFHDSSCASGFIYDESAGNDANKCVPEADFVTDAAPPTIDSGPTPDAGTIDGPTSDAGTIDGPTPDA